MIDGNLDGPRPSTQRRGEAGVAGVSRGGTVAPLSAVRKRKVVSMRQNAIVKKHIEWLWKPYLQRKAINVLTGDPGIGKSTVVCDIAARLSAGRPLPGQDPLPPMNVWIMNGEDNAADTICWRLDNQGSDPARVLITDQVQIIDRAVAAEIAQIITEQHIALCVIDPLQAWMGGGVDMHRANETREWAGMLRSIAQDTDCAFLFVRHRRKSASGDNKLYAGMGSIDITGFARSEISAIKAKDDTTYIVRSKGNVGTTGEALAYTIERHSDPLNDHGTLKWGASYAPNELPEGRATPSRVPRNLKVAKEWLAGFLADGPKTATEVFKAATLRGITEGTLKRAKVGVAESYQQPGETGAVWMWRFVEDGCESGVAGKARG